MELTRTLSQRSREYQFFIPLEMVTKIVAYTSDLPFHIALNLAKQYTDRPKNNFKKYCLSS